MKISQRIVLTFSLMTLIVLTSFAIFVNSILLENSRQSNFTLFSNTGTNVLNALEQQVGMMDITAEELLDNVTFMSALNQFVSNDSSDGKVANAARNAVLQQLYRSPMVDSFYRVSFYNSSGDFITSRIQKDDYLESGTPQAAGVIAYACSNRP